MNQDVITRVVEGQIQEAIEEGKFDNLPGKGKPLVFDEDPTVPNHIRIANRVLKNAGVVPEWVQIRLDILDEKAAAEKLFQKIVRESAARRARIKTEDPSDPYTAGCIVWLSRSRESYLKQLKTVNTSILKYCMSAPSTAEPFTPYNIDKEMNAFDETVHFQPVGDFSDHAPREDSLLRKSVLARYLKSRER